MSWQFYTPLRRPGQSYRSTLRSAEGTMADRDALQQAFAETELPFVPIEEFLAEW